MVALPISLQYNMGTRFMIQLKSLPGNHPSFCRLSVNRKSSSAANLSGSSNLHVQPFPALQTPSISFLWFQLCLWLTTTATFFNSNSRCQSNRNAPTYILPLSASFARFLKNYRPSFEPLETLSPNFKLSWGSAVSIIVTNFTL